MRSVEACSAGCRIVAVMGFGRQVPMVPREMFKHSMQPTVAWVKAVRSTHYADTSTTWKLLILLILLIPTARMTKLSLHSIKERDDFTSEEYS